MCNKERVKTIVSEWFELKTGINLSNETLSRLVDDIIENEELRVDVVFGRREQLKDEEIPSIDDWIKDQGYTQITFSYVYKKEGTYKDKEELYKEYRKEFCL